MKKHLCTALILFAAFVLWTSLVCFIDTKPIGPNGSVVGFATVNAFIHKFTGVHLALYTLTDWLGLVPIGLILLFTIVGLFQLIKRKSLAKVDKSILSLGGFYIAVFAFYLLFETFIVNYRPTLINGYLEASYPSSTTMLVMCVIPTSVMQFNRLVRNVQLRQGLKIALYTFMIFMVVARLISGVHWLSDIIGGILLSSSLVTLYRISY